MSEQIVKNYHYIRVENVERSEKQVGENKVNRRSPTGIYKDRTVISKKANKLISEIIAGIASVGIGGRICGGGCERRECDCDGWVRWGKMTKIVKK